MGSRCLVIQKEKAFRDMPCAFISCGDRQRLVLGV